MRSETVDLVAGEYALTWGRWTMTMPGPDGNPVTVEGRYSDVKAKSVGRWVFIQDHAFVPMRPPPASELPKPSRSSSRLTYVSWTLSALDRKDYKLQSLTHFSGRIG